MCTYIPSGLYWRCFQQNRVSSLDLEPAVQNDETGAQIPIDNYRHCPLKIFKPIRLLGTVFYVSYTLLAQRISP